MKDSPKDLSRRDFLGSANCAALGSIGLYNALINLKAIGNVAAQSTTGDSYKAAVCLFLRGGNDSYNMLIPRTAAEFSNYQAIRSNMAHPGSGEGMPLSLNRVDSAKTPYNNNRSFGLHPSMPGVKSLFDSGKLAFVANVGTLVEPTTIAQYESKGVRLPQNLFAHNSQVVEWQTSVPQGGVGTGWLGRMADLLGSPGAGYNTGALSMNISLAGNNTMQVGEESFAYSITENGSIGLDTPRNNIDDEFRNSQTKSLMEETYRNLYVEAFAKQSQQSFELHDDFSAAFGAVSLNTVFPNTALGRELRGIARSIAAQGALGHQRQTYFVERGGFDNHTDLLSDQAILLSDVDQAVTAFWNSLGELGLQDNVVLFTASDFSRTLRSNGQGTDHAWGGNHFVLGGNVDGQKIYGKYPTQGELTIGSGLDVGTNGRMLPTTSIDEYYADLALWMGVPSGDLSQVLPNIGNFHTGITAPIGYLSSV